MHLDNLIDDFAISDARRLPYDVEDMDDLAGDTLAKAYFTVKAEANDSDDEALIQKQITAVSNSDGQIDSIGGGSPVTDAHMFFDFAPGDTDGVVEPDIFYHYDVKVFSTGGAPKIVDGGRIIFRRQITRKTS